MRDPEVTALAALFEAERRKPRTDMWSGSPFGWLAPWPPSKTKGMIFEAVVHRWCEEMGLEVAHSGDSEADRVIGGRRFEIKGSTLWKAGHYTFQQLRDQNYDAVICLGVSPFNAHCWILPKEEIRARRKTGEISSQHGGRSGRDTAWLWVDPEAPDEWLHKWGGSLAEAQQVLRRFLSASGG